MSTISKPELATEINNESKSELGKCYLLKRCPRTKPETLQLPTYFELQRELSMLGGVVYCDLSAVIPVALRKRLLDVAQE